MTAWTCVLLVGWLACGAPTLAADDLTDFHFTANWTAATGVGLHAGVALGNLDADARDEIVTASHNSWQIFEQQGTRLVETFSSLPMGEDISCVRIVSEPGGGIPRVLVAAGSRIEIWDGRSHTRVREILLPSAPLTSILAADLDLDGDLELVACDPSDLYLLDYSSGVLLQVKYGFGCTDLDLGQIDADPTPELLLAGNGYAGLALDGASLEVDWAFLERFGPHARFVQADADATEEIVTTADGGAYSQLELIDPDTSTIRYTTQPGAGRSVIDVGDVDGDGAEEILLGQPWTGDVLVLNADTGTQIRLLDRDEDAPAVGLATGDCDGDGGSEVVVAGTPGAYDFGHGSLVAFEPSSGSASASSLLVSGYFQSLITADLDGDGTEELVAGDYGFPHDPGGRLVVFDLSSGRELGASPYLGNSVVDLASADLELDGDDEVCAATSPGIACYDGSALGEMWSIQFPPGLSPQVVELADILGDGRPELLVGTDRDVSLGGPYLFSFDGQLGVLRWRSPNLGDDLLGPIHSIRVANLLPDPGLEVLAMTWNGSIVLFDDATGATLAGPFPVPDAVFVDLSQIDADPETDIIVATWNGIIETVDPTDGTVETILTDEGSILHSFATGEVTRDGAIDLVYTTNDGLLRVFDTAAMAVVWDSGAIGFYPGGLHGLLVGDLDGDSVPEIAFETGYGFAVVESPLASVFSDGFETGDTSAWSASVP